MYVCPCLYQVICKTCGTVGEREEAFHHIPLDVKVNNNIHDAFGQFVNGETISDYKYGEANSQWVLLLNLGLIACCVGAAFALLFLFLLECCGDGASSKVTSRSFVPQVWLTVMLRRGVIVCALPSAATCARRRWRSTSACV